MGLLQNGQWVDKWYETKPTDGRYVRKPSAFRNWITADGSIGPSGVGGFKTKAGRYHLYVFLACPWAQRTLIFRHPGVAETVDITDIKKDYYGSHETVNPTRIVPKGPITNFAPPA